MSKMKELCEKVSKDAALQAKLTEILSKAEKAGEDPTKEKLVKFAKNEGYDITIEEMRVFFNDLAENSATELSAAELDMVAGGKGSFGLFFSIGSLGIGCAVLSLLSEKTDGPGKCKEHLESDFGMFAK